MPRNKLARIILSTPEARFFKPQGVCLKDLKVIKLHDDEFEAIKLHDFDKLSQINSAQAMGISQPTFGRILHSAYQKLSRALFQGKAITIEEQKKGNNYVQNQDQKYFDYSGALCDVCGRHCLAD